MSEFAPPAAIGFIGIGAMGAPMARNLAASGWRVHVYDAAPGAAASFAETTDCETPATLAELGAACDAVITMLPNGEIVRQVLLGAGEGADCVLADPKPGLTLIDMSSSSPTGTVALAGELAGRGIPLVDAPVSGGVPRAAAGTLAIMVGGEDAAVERVLPVFAPMGKATRTGAAGSGHAMKALNNFLSATNLAAAAEALIAGERFGLDRQVMLDVWNASSGRNTGTAEKLPAYVMTGSFSSGFALKLMAKDLRLALDVAKSGGAPSPLLAQTSGLYDAAEEAFGPGADNTDIYRYLESLAEPGG